MIRTEHTDKGDGTPRGLLPPPSFHGIEEVQLLFTTKNYKHVNCHQEQQDYSFLVLGVSSTSVHLRSKKDSCAHRTPGHRAAKSCLIIRARRVFMEGGHQRVKAVT